MDISVGWMAGVGRCGLMTGLVKLPRGNQTRAINHPCRIAQLAKPGEGLSNGARSVTLLDFDQQGRVIASQQALGAGQYRSLMPFDIQLDEADPPQAWCQIQGVQPLARNRDAPPGHRANQVGGFYGGKSRGLVGDVQFHLARFVGKGNGMDASPPPEARLQKSGLLRVGFKNVQFKNTPGERRGEKSPRAADIQPKAAGLDQPSRQFDTKAVSASRQTASRHAKSGLSRNTTRFNVRENPLITRFLGE